MVFHNPGCEVGLPSSCTAYHRPVSNDVAGQAIPEASRFWAVARLVWAGTLAVGVGVGLIESRGLLYGCIGSLTGMVLLEIRLIRDGRSPFFHHWRKPR